MSSRIIATAFDCRDAEALAAFWCAALDLAILRRWHDANGVEYVEAGAEGEPVLLFQPVADRKVAKNRVHLDVRAEGQQYDEVARLVADEPAHPWVVLQDPEGNEFCVLPPDDVVGPGAAG